MKEFDKPLQVVVTGGEGLLGYHLRAAMTAENCARKFKGEIEKYQIQLAPRLEFASRNALAEILENADVVLHLAGVNRADPEIVESANSQMALELVAALSVSGSNAHLIYSNSTHCHSDTHYGRGKKAANDTFETWAAESGGRYVNVILPHIFGENAKPFYNNVTATLCHQVAHNETPTIHEGAAVELVHAGIVADRMLQMIDEQFTGMCTVSGKKIAVESLYEILLDFRENERRDEYPDFSSELLLSLYNCYRWFSFPQIFPQSLQMNSDERGVLFEAVKGGGGGQTFMSWTKPGIERGNHFHRRKVERFLVVSGQADIRIRKLFDDQVQSFSVSGDSPVCIDMLTLHTHSIINTGKQPLLTLFWAHELFDTANPDTYALSVSVDDSGELL